MENNSLNRILVNFAAIVIILAGIKLAGAIVVPFLLSLFIAIILSPAIKFMTDRRVPHWLALTLVFVFILVLFFFLASIINNTIREFTQAISQYRVLLNQRISDFFALAEQFNLKLPPAKEGLIEHFDPSALMDYVSRLLLSFSNVVTSAFVLFLVVVFMLLEAPTAKHKLAVALSHSKEDVAMIEGYLNLVLLRVIDYLGVKTLTSLMTGISVWLLLTLLNVQYAILWATLTFLLNYIPNIGSIIAAIPIIVQVLLLNGFGIGFVVALGIIGINTLVGNILEPRMMGRRLGLSTLVVFLSLLFWGWLLGTVGMLLSVPLTIAFKIALETNPATIKYAALLGEVEHEDSEFQLTNEQQ